MPGGRSEEQIAHLYALTNMRQLPHLRYFPSVPDLLLQLATADLPAARRAMREAYVHLVQRSVQVVASQLAQLLE